MFLSSFRVLDGYLFHRNRYLCAMLLVSVAGANAAGAPAAAPAAAVPLLPAELSTLVTAAIRNHPVATPSVSPSSKVRIEHIRAVDKSRLAGHIIDMGEDDLSEIERALCRVLAIKTK